MAAILTAAEMRALEQEAIARGEVTGLELMERAGRGVVDAILAEWPEAVRGPQRAVVLCGPGNNGGDGYVVARLLAERAWDVTVCAYPLTDRTPPDARANRGRLPPSVEVVDFDLDPERPSDPFAYEVEEAVYAGTSSIVHVIDALFGIGLTRGAEVPFWIWQDLSIWPLEGIHDDVRIVAVDVPSGLCADSGRPLVAEEVPDRRAAMTANLTVTFQALKPGHLLAEGPDLCGKVHVVNIGLPVTIRRDDIDGFDPEWMPARLRNRVAKRTGHKYAHGHALLLSGGAGRGGAARMAARGALRIGAGLVSLAVPPAALQENAARLDAVMLRSVRDAEALTDLLSDARFNALAAGPGLGTSDREAALLHALLDASRGAGEGPPATPDGPPGAPATKPRAVVLDADALTLLSRDEALRAKLHAACVLTPHEGEFARLFPAIAERWHAPVTTGPAYSKVDAARDAARECGAVVLLKGPDTVIADPSGEAAINAAVYDRAAPWLATAGSGDVLAGFIAGLLARGFAPFDAACTAAWLHVECARSFGPGLIAEDLADELPKVFRALGL